jgi:micrococcal nuclease
MNRTYHGAQVIRVIDGDTVVLDVDLGFDVWCRYRSFRLLGCNAREHSMVGGQEATVNLRQLLPVGSIVELTSVKPDKFGGRYDAKIMLSDGWDLVDLLIATGWAAAWSGVGVKPMPVWPTAGGDHLHAPDPA